MATISNKKKKFIKKNFKKLSIDELSRQTNLNPSTIRSLVNQYRTDQRKKERGTLKKPASSEQQSLKLIGVWAIVIFIVTILVYIPALNNDFVNWDDNKYVYQNKNIHFFNLQSLYWMLTSFHASNWHPLTWLSHALDYALWGLNPLGHHLTNILLHGFNTLLVFLLAIKLTTHAQDSTMTSSNSKTSHTFSTQTFLVAGVTAALFGLHPVHVESVVWISERKDLLAAFFFILIILSYVSYTSLPTPNRSRWFPLSILFFALALMAKPMAVSVPIVLLLIDWYPLKRLDNPGQKLIVLLKEKIPFFILSITSAIITLIAQYSGGAVGSMEQFPLGLRLMNASRSLLFYLGKMVYPLELSPFYPFPADAHWLGLPYLLSGFVVVLFTLSCLWMIKRKNYLIPIIWFYFVVTLLPVIGVMQVGIQAAADRYTYLPSLAIFLLAGLGISWIYQKAASIKYGGLLKGTVLLVTAIILLLLGQSTINQIKVWQNSESLWSYVISIFPKSIPIAHNNLGLFYHEKEMLEKALAEYNQASSIDADYINSYNNLGVIYDEMDKFEDAIIAFNKALTIDPHYTEAYYNLGNAYAARGMSDEARSHYKQALISNPHYAEAHNNLGLIYEKQGKVDEAMFAYKQAINSDPYYAEAHNNLGNTYVAGGMRDKAISEYKKAISINPIYVKAYTNLGITYGEMKRVEKSIETLKKALALKADDPEIHSNLAVSYYLQGNHTLARSHTDKALALGYSVNPKLLELLKTPQKSGK